jgi:hypothetical protein
MPRRPSRVAWPAASCGSPSDSAPRSAVELDQVEGVQHGIADGAAPVEGVEDGDPVRVTDGLTVERERQRAELYRGHNDRRIPAALIVVTSREQAHRVAVSLDLACSHAPGQSRPAASPRG